MAMGLAARVRAVAAGMLAPGRAALARAALPYLLLLALPAGFVALVAHNDAWPLGHDRYRYPVLAEHFAAAFRNGQWYPRWLPEINGGYGYPTFVFYQPLFFFLVLPFRLLLGEPVAAVWAAIALTLGAGAAGAYRLGARGGSQLLGVFAGLVFLLTPYLCVDWLVRGDLSELLALVLVLWALNALHAIAVRWDARLPVAAPLVGLAVFTAGAFLAHPITGLLFGPTLFILIVALTVTRENGIDRRLLGRLVLAVGAAIGLATPYWLPLLTLRHQVQLEAASAEYYQPVFHTVRWYQLIGGPWGFGGSAVNSDQDGLSFEAGRLQLALAATGALVGWSNRFVRGAAIALGLSLAAMTPSAAALWRLPILAEMQFPWRLLSVVTGLEIALLVAWTGPTSPLHAWPKEKLAALLGVLLVTAGWRPEQFSIKDRRPHTRAAVAKQVAEARFHLEAYAAQDEFLPKTAPQRPTKPLGHGALVEAPATATLRPRGDHGHHGIDVEVALTAPAELVINQLYFPGWRVFIDGAQVPDTTLEALLAPDGRIRVALDPAHGTRQRVTARYAGPPFAAGRFAGLAGAALFVAALLHLERRRGSA